VDAEATYYTETDLLEIEAGCQFGQVGIEWVHRGLKYFDRSQRDKYYFAGQFCPLCVEINVVKSFSINWGVGYGTLGSFKVGVDYSF
jgi:hypothetical protein